MKFQNINLPQAIFDSLFIKGLPYEFKSDTTLLFVKMDNLSFKSRLYYRSVINEDPKAKIVVFSSDISICNFALITGAFFFIYSESIEQSAKAFYEKIKELASKTIDDVLLIPSNNFIDEKKPIKISDIFYIKGKQDHIEIWVKDVNYEKGYHCLKVVKRLKWIEPYIKSSLYIFKFNKSHYINLNQINSIKSDRVGFKKIPLSLNITEDSSRTIKKAFTYN